MNNIFFTKKMTCPVCRNLFDVTKVKGSSLRMVKRDEDFCTHYEPVNSLLYNVVVCSECGYAAMDDRFETISDKDIKVIKEKIKSKWTKRNFGGERDFAHAIEMYKLALLNLQIRNSKPSEIARVCIRIAWLYRIAKSDKEKDFLKYALDAYMDAFGKENLSNENLDERTCMYMIGELNRRLGNNQEALKWLYMVISYRDKKTETIKEAKNPDDSENGEDDYAKELEKKKEVDERKKQAKSSMIVDMARNQMQLIKESK